MKRIFPVVVLAALFIGSCGAAPTPPQPNAVAETTAVDNTPNTPATPTTNTAPEVPQQQTLELTVTAAGYTPSLATVKTGVPLTLTVTRTTNNTCAREIIIDSYNINKPLPMNQPVVIELTPGTSDISYHCAMSMFRGKLKVE